MVDILRTGQSGVLAFQRALATTSHNIANANTPGYSRQRVELTNNQPSFLGGLGTAKYIGTGVSVRSIGRVYDDFLTRQTRGYSSNVGQMETLDRWISQLDGMIGDSDTGLAPALQQFFASMQDVANSPASPPARQAMLGRAETLAAQFRDLDARMNTLRDGVQAGLTGTVDTINTLAANIAKANQAIAIAQGGTGTAPSDLLDQRDQMLADLARNVPVDTFAQSDGTLTVFIGNGQTLVLGNQAKVLETASSTTDPRKLDIRFRDSRAVITGFLPGGEVGGYLAFQDQVLDPAQDKLNLMAIGLRDTFNAQHQLGKDLNGQPGGDFFTLGDPPSAGTLQVAIQDPAGIAAAAADGDVGDNRNALALAGLQTGKTLIDGTSSYQDVYAQIVAEIGARGSGTRSMLQAQQALLEHATQARDSVSGVNLDEEAIDLMRYQQAYEAAAKVIQVGDSLIQTLLDAFRR